MKQYPITLIVVMFVVGVASGVACTIYGISIGSRKYPCCSERNKVAINQATIKAPSGGGQQIGPMGIPFTIFSSSKLNANVSKDILPKYHINDGTYTNEFHQAVYPLAGSVMSLKLQNGRPVLLDIKGMDDSFIKGLSSVRVKNGQINFYFDKLFVSSDSLPYETVYKSAMVLMRRMSGKSSEVQNKTQTWE